jgi:cell division topological specificity factor
MNAAGRIDQRPDRYHPAMLETLQAEIIEVISRHVDVDPDSVRIDIEHEGRSQRLIADIPLRSVPRRRAG